MRERSAAVQADAGNAGNRELDDQNVPFLATGIISGRADDGTHCTVGKGLGVEVGCFLGVLVVP
ncbi:hypothetical protein D3C72_2310610 [compost metagenome]